ncbi:MAG TPA: hypothetical protein PK548_04375 [Bacteroidales bacterium]|nr:hypothetical protein [Bacteroidales bacterium]HQA86353.1 hypothetical protein [Bacteroidales bacterium]
MKTENVPPYTLKSWQFIIREPIVKVGKRWTFLFQFSIYPACR